MLRFIDVVERRGKQENPNSIGKIESVDGLKHIGADSSYADELFKNISHKHTEAT